MSAAGRAGDVAERRVALEQVVKAGAEWGYRMAMLGVTPCPVPVLEWDEQGRPRVMDPEGCRPERVGG